VPDNIFTVANGVTTVRVILLGFFAAAVFADNQLQATALFVTIWLLDGVDGLAARLLHQETVVGSLFDKVVDRFLIIGGSIIMIGVGMLPASVIWLLTKDICLAPVLSIHASRGEKIADLGLAGKITTVLQGVGLIWLLLELPWPNIIVGAVAITGGWVAFRHVRSVVYRPAAV
jgi:cardiolipin synthase